MSEIHEGGYRAYVAEPISGGHETLLLIQPPLKVTSALWKRALISAMNANTESDQEDHVASEKSNMIESLAVTDRGSLFAVQTAPFREPYNPDNENHFHQEVLEVAAGLALRANIITREPFDSDRLHNLSNDITLF